MTIVEFFAYDADGKIHMTGVCPEPLLSYQSCPGCEIGVGHAVIGETYFDLETREIRRIPDRPSPHHIFDYSTKQWVDPRTLDDLKAEKWAEIKRKRDEVEFGGFVWDGSRFDSDETSQSRIQGAVQLASLAVSSGQPFSVVWTLADNTTRTLSADDMLAVGQALAEHVNNCHTVARRLREAINNATSREDLDAIEWPSVV